MHICNELCCWRLPFIIFFFVFVIAWSPCTRCALRALWKRSNRHACCSTHISMELPCLVSEMNSKAHSAVSALQHLQRHTWTLSIHVSLPKRCANKMTPSNPQSARIPSLCKSWIKCMRVVSMPFFLFFVAIMYRVLHNTHVALGIGAWYICNLIFTSVSHQRCRALTVYSAARKLQPISSKWRDKKKSLFTLKQKQNDFIKTSAFDLAGFIKWKTAAKVNFRYVMCPSNDIGTGCYYAV